MSVNQKIFLFIIAIIYPQIESQWKITPILTVTFKYALV